MRSEIDIHWRAEEEILSAITYYTDIDRDLGMDFDARIDAAIRQIVAKPEVHPPYLHGTRRYLLKRFPFSVVYRLSESQIQIIAIAHRKRRPGYWRNDWIRRLFGD